MTPVTEVDSRVPSDEQRAWDHRRSIFSLLSPPPSASVRRIVLYISSQILRCIYFIFICLFFLFCLGNRLSHLLSCRFTGELSQKINGVLAFRDCFGPSSLLRVFESSDDALFELSIEHQEDVRQYLVLWLSLNRGPRNIIDYLKQHRC